MARKYFKRRSRIVGKAKEYKISMLSKLERVVFELVCENCYPSGGHATEPTVHNLMLFYYLMEGKKVNPGHTILWYMLRATNYKKTRFPYGGLITALCEKAGVKPVGRPLPFHYYGDSWLIHKGLEIKSDGTLGAREPITSKKGEKLHPAEEKKWRKHILRCFGFLQSEVDQAKKEVDETRAEVSRLVSTLDLPMELSEGEEPSFEVANYEEPREGDEEEEEYDGFAEEEEEDDDDDQENGEENDASEKDAEGGDDDEEQEEEEEDEEEDEEGEADHGEQSDDALADVTSSELESDEELIGEDDILNDVTMDLDPKDMQELDERLQFNPSTIGPSTLDPSTVAEDENDEEDVIDGSNMSEEEIALLQQSGYKVERRAKKAKTKRT